eukprot:6769096-Lingulodinium_polyedra.AAC.1
MALFEALDTAAARVMHQPPGVSDAAAGDSPGVGSGSGGGVGGSDGLHDVGMEFEDGILDLSAE